MKNILSLLILFLAAVGFGQESTKDIVKKLVEVRTDTIQIDSVSINPGHFEVYDRNGIQISRIEYVVDYARAILWFNDTDLFYGKTIHIEYLPYPEFLTKTYSAFDRSLIVSEATDQSSLYSSRTNNRVKNSKPFEGLYTSGSLSRGVTIGSNQDAVVNSNFNLQIEGRLSEKVGIRASITDNEIPLQSGGFTQRLDEFDQVFIELFSDNWSLTAGDIDLLNTENYLMRFQKKISGVLVKGKIQKPLATTDFFASGALVRGKFRSYKFVGIDGNQGPYKILGEDNQQYIIMISGSERVYANGVLLRRGENFDYTIDYNTGEISFTTLYTVTSNLRFTVEYQLSERNYTRFLTYDGVGFKSEKLKLGIKYFNETDAKNSPLDQNLSDEQKKILSEAGDDKSKMVSPSEVESEYNENRVLYRKTIVNGKEIFEFSNDPNDELYQVTFSYVGENNGDYDLENTLAAGRVYAYVPEFNNQKQGDYLPVVQLIAPEKYQMLHLEADYNPGEKTLISSELALSDNDQNLFSSLDNENNEGFAAKVSWKQGILDKKWKLNSELDYEYFSKDFVSIERIRNVEFSRDWNILSNDLANLGEQQFIRGGLELNLDSLGTVAYRYEHLSLGDDYQGDRHNLQAAMQFNQTHILLNGSSMKNKNQIEKNSFDRLYSSVVQNISKYWVGGKFNYEKNQIQNATDLSLNELSHAFSEIEGFVGVGDSSKVFVEIGYNFRLTDSVQNESLSEVNRSHTYFLKSRLIQNANTDLSIFANYRNVQNLNIQNENSLNARLAYRQRILGDFISLQTLLETNSGTLPQQEFSYVEVEPGKGFYEWIDFNDNGIQELDEFVIARFQDQAIYVRVLLPTVSFIRTNQNKWSQSINLKGAGWRNEAGLKKAISHFSNQTYFLIDVKTKRDGDDFTVTPFIKDENDVLGMDQNFKNSLFFNRGMQRYSFVYTYLNFRKKTIFSFGDQDVSSNTHQFRFIHKLGSNWLFDLNSGLSNTQSESVTYSNRNYNLDQYDLNPKLSYLYDQNTRLEFFYKFKDKKNTTGGQETLLMHIAGLNFNYAGGKGFSINSNFNLYLNDFVGSTNSPVAYQMLEGLQPGTNLTWLLGMQKRLTSFLDLNLNYSGRKSESSDTIHTGNIQLRATF
ncbi:hypothetical protein [Lutimonas zeaxanthinifaciens]|uniref:hypothetical protein n=1 Tax=Lutimonas zeaxanthinifaciens TaxID=3060215 RepID=UPI00265CD0C6|nr:hypothetical protein [Lutimonas sp. YSD2104]WKK66903.1 hypothetical protein QZH61_04610 [Lutimonas sp. YSD2104]